MALAPLATAADLSARGVDTTDLNLVNEMLAVASAVVRAACQSPVSETTSTVTVWAYDGGVWLDLPGKPVTAVTAVTVDGDTVPETDYKLVDGRLWRRTGWAPDCEPTPVVVTLTHGYAVVPDDVRQLVVDLAVTGLGAASSGLRSGIVAESIDDYSVTFADGAEAVASAFTLPPAVRVAFRRRFGGGVGMVVSR